MRAGVSLAFVAGIYGRFSCYLAVVFLVQHFTIHFESLACMLLMKHESFFPPMHYFIKK